MSLNQDEKDYISKIFNHGVAHLSDDAIPNRIICVHNIHWCIENLLRKASQEWTNIDYRAGFEDILNIFDSRHNIPIDLKNEMRRLNTIRNDMEHRSLFHDIRDILNLIPKAREFISWIAKIKFNTIIDLYSVSAADESNIITDFNNWKRMKIEQFDINNFENLIFILIIPTTYSPNIIEMHIDGINEMVGSTLESGVRISGRNPEHESAIEKYFRSFRHIFSHPSQVFSIPTYMRYYNEIGDELRVFPDGRIYIAFKFGMTVRDELGFNIENLYSGREVFNINSQYITYYNLPFNEYRPNMLEYILKLVLYSFHPDNIHSGVKALTKFHRIFITLPFMRRNGEPCKLDRHLDDDHWFESPRIYCGEEEELTFKRSINFDEIQGVLEEFKNWTYSFFRNPHDTGFM